MQPDPEVASSVYLNLAREVPL